MAVVFVVMTITAVTFGSTSFAFAQTGPATGGEAGWRQRGPGGPGDGIMGGGRARPVVIGTVSAVNGSTLTVSGHEGFATGTAATTYTVDAANAKVTKDRATSSVANIAVGDTVAVSGTLSGTNVTATDIRDGVMPQGKGGPGMMGERGKGRGNASSTDALAGIQGNGQPVVGGTVSSVNGATVVITNKSNVTYTIDATSAKITQKGAAVTTAALKTGDQVVVQGTVNGTSIVATTIIDQGQIPAQGTGTGPAPKHAGGIGGFFGAIGGFFGHLFGF